MGTKHSTLHKSDRYPSWQRMFFGFLPSETNCGLLGFVQNLQNRWGEIWALEQKNQSGTTTPKSLPLKYSSSTLDVMCAWSSSSILLVFFLYWNALLFSSVVPVLINLSNCLYLSNTDFELLRLFLSSSSSYIKSWNFGCLHLLQGAPGPWCELLDKTILAFVEVSSTQGSSFTISWVSSLELSCCGKLKSQNHHIICHL